MEQIKIFSESDGPSPRFNDEINEWFTANPTIKIKDLVVKAVPFKEKGIIEEKSIGLVIIIRYQK